MSMRRLAIVCFEDPRRVSGGVQRRVAAEIAYFAQRGVEVVVITEGSGTASIDGGVRYIPISTPKVIYPVRALFFAAKASRQLRQIPDVEVIETHHDAGVAAVLGAPRQCVFVEFVHGVFRDEFAALRRHEPLLSRSTLAASGLLLLSVIEKAAARRSTAVVTVSHYAAEQVARRYGVDRQRVHVVPNGIDTRRYAPPQTRERSDLLSILYVGRWHARKGVLQLIRAFANAHGIDRRLRLKLIGGGPLEPILRNQCVRLGLADAVAFLGTLKDEDVVEAYRSADIACVPSLQEGQGIVALEAQACGVPVVATRAGGLTEAVKDRHTGILVAPGDVTALADALLELTRDETLRCELGRKAAVWARSFAWEDMLARSESLYEGLLASVGQVCMPAA